MDADIHAHSTCLVSADKAASWPVWLRHCIFWSLAGGGLALDLWSKAVVFSRPEYVEGVPLIKGFLSLRVALNHGAAFSIASGQRTLLCTVSILALLGVIGFFLFGRMHSRLVTVSLGLLTGGIAGNLWDRLFNDGKVRDFIDINLYFRDYHWPTFNVADSLLCIAVGLLIIGLHVTGPSRPVHDPPQK